MARSLSREEKEILVNEVYKYPVIYDRDHPDNKNRAQLDKAWAQIAYVFQELHDMTSIKKIWKNLVDTRRKLLTTSKLPGRDNKKKIERWALKECTDFLDKYLEKSPKIMELNRLIAEGRVHEYEERRQADIARNRALDHAVAAGQFDDDNDDNNGEGNDDDNNDVGNDDDFEDDEDSQNHMTIKQERVPDSVGTTITPIVPAIRLQKSNKYKPVTRVYRKRGENKRQAPALSLHEDVRGKRQAPALSLHEDVRGKRMRDTICDQMDGDRCYFNSLYQDFANLPEKVKLLTKTKLMQVIIEARESTEDKCRTCSSSKQSSAGNQHLITDSNPRPASQPYPAGPPELAESFKQRDTKSDHTLKTNSNASANKMDHVNSAYSVPPEQLDYNQQLFDAGQQSTAGQLVPNTQFDSRNQASPANTQQHNASEYHIQHML